MKALSAWTLAGFLALAAQSPAFAQPQAGAAAARNQAVAAAAARPTPRDAAGKPNMTGYWTANPPPPPPPPGTAAAPPPPEDGDVLLAMAARGGSFVNFENDAYIRERAEQNIPQYKPEHWAKVQELDRNGNKEDPVNSCQWHGIPRAGPPARIIQLGEEVVLFHNQAFSSSFFRFIHSDGRKPLAEDLTLETWFGIPTARWEGDTLVIESIGFNDVSWIGDGGYFHSADMKVTERLTRKGDTLEWRAVVEDPQVLLEPWALNPRTLFLNTNPRANIPESPPCEERDFEHFIQNVR